MKIGEMATSRSNMNPSHSPKQPCYILIISKSINKLKWHPKLDLDETVKFTIDEYKTEEMEKEEIYMQRLKHINRYMDI